ncbi:MAG: lipoate--protein ligase family protein [Nanoarchaeota archaeon]|nr:lipoate--protein ligase family protein [Nanoarchaeota archaeon]MBU1704179.1 lipoate--protein ligase family protein [Nanoarchaeota archaeon]
MQKMRFIDTGFNTPSMNMAIDEALLSSKEPVLRFYRWKPAGLSIGYFQSVKTINLDNLKKHNIQLVRRLTGGNAVLHDQELTYSFIIDEDKMPSSVIESYKIISQGLLDGLKILGLSPIMNETVEKKEKSPVCFEEPSWYEILVNKKKIVGSAQKRTKGKVLQHGSILLKLDIERYASLFNHKLDIERLKNRIISLNDLAEIDYNKLSAAIKQGFSKHYSLKESGLSHIEIDIARSLDQKYLSDEWNFTV